MNHQKLFIVLLALWLSACSNTSQQASREATAQLVSRLATRQLETHDGAVERHVLNGKVYYLLRAPCCDRGGELYDALGNYVCNPNGGFSGMGDRRCPALRQALNQSEGEFIRNPFYGLAATIPGTHRPLSPP